MSPNILTARKKVYSTIDSETSSLENLKATSKKKIYSPCKEVKCQSNPESYIQS